MTTPFDFAVMMMIARLALLQADAALASGSVCAARSIISRAAFGAGRYMKRLSAGADLLYFTGVKQSQRMNSMSCAATLRKTGGSITLSIPKSIAQTLSIDAGSIVELTVKGQTLSVTPMRRSLADRLAASPKSPASWHRDEASLRDRPVGRELL